MSANTFGELFRLTSFGESHGKAMGAVIDGCPAGVLWNDVVLRTELERRRPGQFLPGRSVVVTERAEPDIAEVLSGVYEGKTLGTPIAILIRNQDARSEDYEKLRPRTGHADDVWRSKFGHSDPRGGGRSSGRETVSRVLGGSVASMFVRSLYPQLRLTGFASRIGPFELSASERDELLSILTSESGPIADRFVARFPSAARSDEVERLLVEAKREGRSHGGTAEVWIDGVPSGLGQPVFRKLKADLASAMMGVGATSGIEVGAGISAADDEGTDFHSRGEEDREGEIYGGIRGGISTGERIRVRVHFKPTSSVLDVAKKGRHDPCLVPRAIPVLEAMAWLVLADHILAARLDRLRGLATDGVLA